MTLETRFNVLDLVRIPDLGLSGRIVGLYMSGLGVEYKVRFASNGEFKEVYFFEDELKVFSR